MTVLIKRKTRRALFLLISLGGFLVFLAVKLIFGGSSVKLTELGSKSKDVLKGVSSGAVGSARADVPDVPPPSGEGGGASTDGGCGSG